jgi:hypothetical protein
LVQVGAGLGMMLGAHWVALGMQERVATDGAATDERLAAPPTDPVVRYEMHARLDATEHRVDARAVVSWRNDSSLPQSELWLHLYLNAFRHPKTLFLRTHAAGFRGASAPVRHGSIEIDRLWARELARDLWAGADAHSPGDPDDATDIRVPLPAPVAPGATLTLEVEWRATLPSVVMRTGAEESFHMVAQWFPKLARLEPDGRWAHFPFHRLSEFYADFGDYDVTLDVPAAFVVGATGTGHEVAGAAPGLRRERFVARGVHDFAFAAWDGFSVRERRTPDGVALRCLYPRGLDAVATLELDTVERGLADLGRAYGRYPYPSLTVVHPPRAAREAGGMEYPTLITTGGRWYAPLLGARTLELVTLHELAHQWFQGLVATDESRWPMLDEGLASYAEARHGERWWPGASAFERLGVGIGLPALWRGWAASAAGNAEVGQPASAFATGGDYGALVYGRTATLLLTLGRVWGDEALERAVGRYARAGRFAHPGPEALLDAVRAELGEDAAVALRAGLFDRGWVDYAVERRGDDGPVVVRRRGSLRFPVEVALVGDDGTTERVRWDARETSLVLAGSERVAAAVVDPEHRVLADEDLTNNAVSRRPARFARRVHARLAYAAGLGLALVAP